MDATVALDLAVLQAAMAVGEGPVETLCRLEDLPPREACQRLAQTLALPTVDSERLATSQARFDLWPLVRAQAQRSLLVSGLMPGRLTAVVADPLDASLRQQLLHATRHEPLALDWALATPDDVHAFCRVHEEGARTVDALRELGDEPAGQRLALDVVSLAAATQSASPAVKLLNSTLFDAFQCGASDIHLEATPTGLRVRFRVDGMLDDAAQVPGVALAAQAISRLKVLAQLDIAERRVPQDGSFQVSSKGRDVDLRVSIMPSVHGEDAVVRILDKQSVIQASGSLSLEGLGFDGENLATLRRLTQAAHGMLLVTGPTGSGKTTTLYAALTERLSTLEKVVTIEDPVEYQLPGVLQIPVNEKKGLNFARGLRSILRHDPDIIMVGEIRDSETAEIAVQSALTGHLVLTTVHANSAFDVFGRFAHMGLDPYAMSSALNGVWAQRLVRLICPRCKQPATADDGLLRSFGARGQALQGARLARGAGCGDCRGTGYRGRRAIAEVLALDDELRELIVAKGSLRELKAKAAARGASSLVDAGLALAMQGETTLEEVRRVALAT